MATKKSLTVRSAAVLTGSAVNATAFSLDRTIASKCSVSISFTIGSLDLGTFAFYVSSDDSTYVPFMLPTGDTAVNFDATGTVSVTVDAPGWKYLRVTALGTGTATSSSATIVVRYT